MGEDSVMLSGRIPSELKELVDADRRDNQEVLRAALWREFGGERQADIDRRIEEKERRISMIKTEKNERQRELEREQQELEALKSKRTAEEEEQQSTWNEALDNLTFNSLNVGTVIESSEKTVKTWADRLDMDVDEFKQEALDKYDG
jgi:chromosome segregation ATPase